MDLHEIDNIVQNSGTENLPTTNDTEKTREFIQQLCDYLRSGCKDISLVDSLDVGFTELKKDSKLDSLSQNEKVLQASREGLIHCLRNFDKAETENFINFVKEKIGINNQSLLSDNVLRSFQYVLSDMISNHYIYYQAERLIDLFNDNLGINKKDLFKDKILEAINDRLLEDLKKGECGVGLDKFIQFIDKNKEFLGDKSVLTDKEKILKAAQNGLSYHFKKGDYEKTEKYIQFVINKFGINKQDLSSNEVLNSVKHKLYDYLYYNEASNAEELINFFHNEFGNKQKLFSDQIIQTIHERISYHLNDDKISIAEQYVQLVNNNKDFFNNQSIFSNQEEIFKAIRLRLDSLSYGVTTDIRELFQLLEKNKDFFFNIDIKEDIIQATQEAVYNCLVYGGQDDVENLLNFVDDNKEIFDHTNVFSDKEKILEATEIGEKHLREVYKDEDKTKKFIQFVNDKIIPRFLH